MLGGRGSINKGENPGVELTPEGLRGSRSCRHPRCTTERGSDMSQAVWLVLGFALLLTGPGSQSVLRTCSFWCQKREKIPLMQGDPREASFQDISRLFSAGRARYVPRTLRRPSPSPQEIAPFLYKRKKEDSWNVIGVSYPPWYCAGFCRLNLELKKSFF